MNSWQNRHPLKDSRLRVFSLEGLCRTLIPIAFGAKRAPSPARRPRRSNELGVTGVTDVASAAEVAREHVERGVLLLPERILVGDECTWCVHGVSRGVGADEPHGAGSDSVVGVAVLTGEDLGLADRVRADPSGAAGGAGAAECRDPKGVGAGLTSDSLHIRTGRLVGGRGGRAVAAAAAFRAAVRRSRGGCRRGRGGRSGRRGGRRRRGHSRGRGRGRRRRGRDRGRVGRRGSVVAVAQSAAAEEGERQEREQSDDPDRDHPVGASRGGGGWSRRRWWRRRRGRRCRGSRSGCCGGGHRHDDPPFLLVLLGNCCGVLRGGRLPL